MHCYQEAAQYYQVPARVLRAIHQVEGGKRGERVPDPNGTFDHGFMQINTCWKPVLHQMAGVCAISRIMIVPTSLWRPIFCERTFCVPIICGWQSRIITPATRCMAIPTCKKCMPICMLVKKSIFGRHPKRLAALRIPYTPRKLWSFYHESGQR